MLDPWTVSEAAAALLKDRMGKRRSAKSIEGYRIHMNILVDNFGDRKLDQITGDDFNDWIASKNWSVSYVRHWYLMVRMLYNFAIQKKRAANKPWLEMYRPDRDDDPPPVYNVHEVHTLLSHASPYVARGLVLGLFCGLRPENEASSITYGQIDLERRKITVVGRKAKSRQHRRVTIPPNLVPWIEKLDWTEPYNYERWRNSLAALRKELGIKSGHDILRHSFGSHHLALYEDEAKTRFEMGHSDSNVLFEHYRALVHKEDAIAYFGITPETTSYGNGASHP
jgi:integrase